MGCWRLADDERVMVELACGVNVALCYDGRLERALGRKVRPDDKVVVMLCGGSNVTVDMLTRWRQEYAYLEDGAGKKEEVGGEESVVEFEGAEREVKRGRRWADEGGEVFALEAKL